MAKSFTRSCKLTLHFNPAYGVARASSDDPQSVDIDRSLWTLGIALIDARRKLNELLNGKGIGEGMDAATASQYKFVAQVLEPRFQELERAASPTAEHLWHHLFYSRVKCHLIFATLTISPNFIREVEVLVRHIETKGGSIISTVDGSASTVWERMCLRFARQGKRHTTEPQVPSGSRKIVPGVQCLPLNTSLGILAGCQSSQLQQS